MSYYRNDTSLTHEAFGQQGHRSIQFRLLPNGDVLIQYSRSVLHPKNHQILLPVRYYLVKHEWFVQAKDDVMEGGNGGHRWPGAHDIKSLRCKGGQEAILRLLQTRLFASEEFAYVWRSDALHPRFPPNAPHGEAFWARIWSAKGHTEGWWQGDKQEQWCMQHQLLTLRSQKPDWTESCLGSVADLPPLVDPPGTQQYTDIGSFQVSLYVQPCSGMELSLC